MTIQDRRLSEEEKKNFNRVWHRLQGWPDSPPGSPAQEAFRHLAVSNGICRCSRRWRSLPACRGTAFWRPIVAHHYKPDKEMYLMPGEFFDMPPSSVMMVAAHPGDLDAAKALGLKTAYVHRPARVRAGKSHGAAGRRPL